MPKKSDEEQQQFDKLMFETDRVVEALRRVQAEPLIDLVNRLRKAQSKEIDMRAPFPLIGNTDVSGRIVFMGDPWVHCRVTHLVLSPETARSYDMLEFNVLNISQAPGEVSANGARSESITPLDTFSIEYMRDEKLQVAQSFISPELHPGRKWRMVVQHHPGIMSVPFRGLLWAETFWV